MDGFSLLRARRLAGLTQQELAAKAGVSPNVIGRIERGGIDPHLTTLTALAEALGVSVAVLVEPLPSESHRVADRRACPSETAV